MGIGEHKNLMRWQLDFFLQRLEYGRTLERSIFKLLKNNLREGKFVMGNL
jgi:hypothetical protein